MRKNILLWVGVVVSCRASVVDVGSPDAGSQSTPVWSGNESNCPTDAPLDETVPCNVREGQSCAWWTHEANGQTSYQGCTCWEENRSTKLWACFRTGASPSCPTVQPASQTDCFGSVGLACPFPPYTQCQCPKGDPNPKWTCGPDPTNGPPQPPVSPPTGVPEDKAIKDLSDAERQAWCTWYGDLVAPPGHPPADEHPIGSDGSARNYGSSADFIFYAPACMPVNIPVDYCAANLKLDPCEATVGELTDCVQTVVRHEPTPHGCGRFFEAANCSDSFVHRRIPSSDGGITADCSSIKVR